MIPDPGRDVLIKARLGDRPAFRKVVDTLARYTFNLAYRMTSNASDAEDLSQEVFLKLYQNLGKYDPGQPFPPWYRRVATNTALNWIRARKARPLAVEEVEVAVAPAEPDETSERVRAAVRKLPEEYRTVVTLRYMEDLSVEEIARALDAPVGTIKTWLFRARDMLKESVGATL